MRLTRYAICSYHSLRVIWTRRPTVVFAPNPSIVLAYLLLVLRGFFKYTFVIDAHYVGVVAAGGSALLQKALNYCNRRADLVIVTNEEHRKHVEALGGRSLVCEDPLPCIGKYAAAASEESRDVFFVCSFAVDEPYEDVFRAASILQQEGYVFWVSGDFRKAAIDPSEFPHVCFIGYVPEPQFYSRMASSQVVVDLTVHENCLVCGAYEAMMLEKPLVTSRTLALQRYFTGGTVFVDHRPPDIARGVRLAYEARSELRQRIKVWKTLAAIGNSRKIEAIRAYLNLPGQKPEYCRN
jgi:glycosyltransferase involved in cell wall biosynthesis